MRIITGCEWSQVITQAFRRLGHDAYSCDLERAAINQDWHINGDVCDHLDDGWDMGIFHPPCRYISKVGSRWFAVYPERENLMMQAVDFFYRLYNCDIPKVCVENPVPLKRAGLPPYSQIIIPWDFGDSWGKTTCLWLRGLPVLLPTEVVAKPERYKSNSKWYANATQKQRSITPPCIADAMSHQWGGY